MYRFKLKEIEVGDTDISRGTKTTVSAIDDKTGRIEWDVVDVADFSSVYKALSKAKTFLDTLEKEGKAKDDVVIDGFAEDIATLFNAFRTHVRKNYPKEYERVSRLKESINEHDLSSNDLDYLESLADRTENVILKKIVGKLKNHTNEDLEVDVELNPTKEKLKVTIPGDFSDNEGEYAVEKELQSQNKEYKDFKIKDIKLKEEEVEEGEGIHYSTPLAFNKKKNAKGAANIYYYKLGFKPVPKTKLKESEQLSEYSGFQQKRINVFGEIEDKINNILPMLSNAKNETAEYYNENPGSYAIVVSTDYIIELLNEIELKLKQVQDK
jgi:hypothetical protein